MKLTMRSFLLVTLALVMLSACVQAQDLGKEIGSLDFANIIGGPLQAVIQAQAVSAQKTAQFITEIGMTKDESDNLSATMVEFSFEQPVGNTTQLTKMSVPFLTMLPIPYIEISVMTLDFAVKLDSVASQTDTSSIGTQTDVEASYSSLFSPVSVSAKVSVTTQHNSESSSEVKRSYSLNIHVQAQAVTIPPGTQRILDILENAILQKPAE